MGVKGLWELLHPVARPIKLEALANKRLAIDASIWLHQFMRGMRDNDGAMVSNAHIIGFFRRICKLLYYNIKPVFVFDGGTPILKRLTIQERRRRKHNDANLVKRTAEKLLAAQLRLRALEHKKAAKKKTEQGKLDKDNVVHDSTEVLYLKDLTGEFLASKKTSDATDQQAPETLSTSTTGSQAKRIKDAYILPPMENDFETLSRIRQNDERFGLSEHDDIQTFLDAFKKEEGLNNIDSEVFQALPSEVQYEILSDIRLRSRVTSYERVQEMVRKSETAMDFSRLQVEGVIRRNNVTHKLLNVNQAISKIEEATVARPGRIASQRNRQYILVKNEDGGWALGGKKSTIGTTKEQPVRLDSDDEATKEEEVDVKVEADRWESEDDEEFEEVKVQSSPRRPLVTSPAGKQPSRVPLRNIAPKSPKDAKETSLLDHIEAYVDEDESVERVMAKFANMEDEARKKNEVGLSPTDPKSEKRPSTGKTVQLGEDPDWPEVLSDDQDLGSFDTLRAEDAFSDVDMFVEDETGETQRSNSGRALTFAEESALTQEAFHSYWTGYTPDSFKVKNADHEFLIQDAIDLWDEDRLENELHSACRKLDKASSNDTIAVESLQFWKTFLEAVLLRRKVVDGDGATTPEYTDSVQELSRTEEKAKSSRAILLDDDDDDDDEILSDDDIVMMGTPLALDPRLIVATSTPKPCEIEESAPSKTDDIGAIDFGSSFLKKPDNTPTQATVTQDATFDAMDTSEEKTDVESPSTTSGLISESIVDVVDKTEDEVNLLVLEGDTELALEEPVDDIAGEEDDDADDVDEARDVDLENEEQDFTNRFPEMAVLPGALVMSEHVPPSETHPVLTAEEQAVKDLKDAATMAEESRKLQGEIKVLKDQHRKHQRDADDLTETMVAETQMLLRLFGIPYIVAPMEAEAQCADLQIRGVVEGILTEDSDVFLFGGLRVFKNMFKEERFVECYLMSDIERDLGVTRDRLVALAYLLGSDYTSGIKGIGLVTAMEILRMFPKLEMFARWWRGEQVKLESEKPKEGEEKNDSSWMEELEVEANDDIALEKLAKACKKVHLPTTFPDPVVAEAYKSPLVDDDEAMFQWGIPDLDGLRDFLRGSLGWGQGEVDSVLLPIIRQMSRESVQSTQTTLDGYFDASAGTRSFQPPVRTIQHKSARLRKVVSRLTGQATEGDAKRDKKKKVTKRKVGAKDKGSNSDGEDKSKNEDVMTINSSSDEKSEDKVEEATQAKKRRTKPTPQTKVPEAVTAAKKNLKSKDVATRLAARNKIREKAANSVRSQSNNDSDIIPDSARTPNPKRKGSYSSGSGSSGEDEDFQSSHWDLLSQTQEAIPRPSPMKKNDAYSKARYGTSLRVASPKSRKKANPNS